MVEHSVGPLVGFCLAILLVKRRWNVGLAIGWRQCCGYIRLGLWWSETEWVSWSESRLTASVEIKLIAYEKE